LRILYVPRAWRLRERAALVVLRTCLYAHPAALPVPIILGQRFRHRLTCLCVADSCSVALLHFLTLAKADLATLSQLRVLVMVGQIGYASRTSIPQNPCTLPQAPPISSSCTVMPESRLDCQAAFFPKRYYRTALPPGLAHDAVVHLTDT
jgi:hypothetical protein